MPASRDFSSSSVPSPSSSVSAAAAAAVGVASQSNNIVARSLQENVDQVRLEVK